MGGSDGSDDGGDDEGEDEGEDEGDDSDDGEQELCAVKIPLSGKCAKTQRQAAKICDNSGMPNCAIVKMNNKCYYSESDKMNGKKYIEMMMPCDDEEGTGGSDDNDDSDGKDDQNVTPPLDWSSVMTASAASTSTCAKIVDCRHFLNLKDVQF